MKTAHLGTLTRETSEAGIAALIDEVRSTPGQGRELLPYLPLQHPLYTGRSTNAVVRIRGYLLAAFGDTGLPAVALPYVLEILESDRSAYLVAAAAIALRGLPAPAPEFASFLAKAFRNVKLVDDAISFDAYHSRWPLVNQTTALLEIIKTFRWMGSGAGTVAPYFRKQCDDCYVSDKVKAQIRVALQAIEQEADVQSSGCCRPLFLGRSSRGGGGHLPREVADLSMEDHLGETIEYGEYFVGRPAVVVLFYTRCDNPNKCSLTVTRLGQLQKQLADEDLSNLVKTAAITYDPVFDSSLRIKAYCEHRGVCLGDTDRAFRIESGTAVLLRYLDSGVNYIGSVVNQHTIELFLLDDNGRVSGRFQQLQWEPAEIVARLRALLATKTGSSGARGRLGVLLSPILSLLIIISPKCPICWAAYLSVLGLTNIQLLRWTGWLLPLFVGLLLANLFSFYRGVARNGWPPFLLNLAGALCISCSLLAGSNTMLAGAGVSLSIASALLNSLPCATYRRLLRIFRSPRLRLANYGKQTHTAEAFGN